MEIIMELGLKITIIIFLIIVVLLLIGLEQEDIKSEY
jgi:hypothetical protein